MSAASSGNASALFDLKSASLTLVAFVLKTGNIQALGQAMAERFGDTPDFFSRDPIVIDLTHLASLDAVVNFEALISLLTSFKLNPVAVRGGTGKQMAAALEAGLGEAPDSHGAPARIETVVKTVVQEVVKEVVREVQIEVPVSMPTMVIDKPLRSGQQIYAKGGDTSSRPWSTMAPKSSPMAASMSTRPCVARPSPAPKATPKHAFSRPAWSPSCCPSQARIARLKTHCPPMCAANLPRSVWKVSAWSLTPSPCDGGAVNLFDI